jgi:hypothetical protein
LVAAVQAVLMLAAAVVLVAICVRLLANHQAVVVQHFHLSQLQRQLITP